MLWPQLFPVFYLVFLVAVVAFVAGVSLAVIEWKARRRMSKDDAAGADDYRWAA